MGGGEIVLGVEEMVHRVVDQESIVAIIDSCEVDSEQGAVACLRRIAPDLPIILISGRLTSQGRTVTPWGEVENIPKPFASDALIKALSGTLK